MTTSKKQKLRGMLLLVIASWLAGHLCFYLLPNVFEIWNAQTIDQLFVLRSSFETLRPPYDSTIAHVDLNNATIQKLGTPYLGRSYFEKVARNLESMEVSAQVYDFIFAAPLGNESDRTMVDAISNAGNAYFGLAFELGKEGSDSRKQLGFSEAGTGYLDRTKWQLATIADPTLFYLGLNPLLTFTELASASRGIGFLSVKSDRDGVLRRVPLLVRYGDGFYPSLSFRVICDYLGVSPEGIVIEPDGYIRLKGARKPEEGLTRETVIPIDSCGNMIVNYVGPWERMDHYSFADILAASDDREELAMWRKELSGKIIVVSDVSTGSTDIGPVPTDSNFPLSGVHANVMHTILTENFMRELTAKEMFFIESLLLFILFALSVRPSSFSFVLGFVAEAMAYIVLVGLCFLYMHVLLNVIRPLLILGFALVSTGVYRYVNEEKEKFEGLRQRDFVRNTFGRYISNEVVEELLNSPEGLKMGGETREVTFLVSDLRGFTHLSGKLSASKVVPMLNRYFEAMVEIVARYRGTVDEFQGDGMLVFFGAPLSAVDDPERAVACAIEMQNKILEINELQRRENLPELAMGIGINTGEVIVGNIGSLRRSKYGAVGSAINTAYRIESHTVGGQVLISPATYEKVKPLVHVRGSADVQFKGIDEPLTLYDVLGMQGRYNVCMP